MDRQRSHPVQSVLKPGLLLTAAALFAACAGLGAQSAHPNPERIERVPLPGASAKNYVTTSVGGSHLFDDPSGALPQAFEHALQARGVALQGDVRLTELSRFIANLVSPDGSMPSQAAIDAAARHLGLVEPTPHFVVVGTDAREGVAERLQEDIEALLAERAYSHYGGVMQERDGIALYVAALVFRFVELAPVPRQLELGDAITLSGSLTHGHTSPELAITEPDGRVVRGAPSRGNALQFEVPVHTRGVYRVEVLGQGPQGITVVANFPVYVGEAPPESVQIASADSAPVDAQRAAEALLEMVNTERAKVKLPALALDATLSKVALAHVDDMLEHGFVAHTSKTTGSAADRVTRAGVKTSIVLENIGRGYSLREVHDGLLASPGHRGNILHELVNRIGIGIRATPESGHTAYLVTEVFTRATPKLDGDATEDLLSRINAKRKSLGRGPLKTDGTLEGLAEKTAARYFTRPPPEDQALMQSVREQLVQAKLPARSVGAVLTVASSVQELSELDAVLESGLKLIGIGLSQGTRPDTPENALCAVLLLGQ
ncbi:MAG TPA: CAP domain-containing protein [Polyangiales bacterium]|nr:CAP domain-containing protein [Polyangiales bacterium]